MSDDEALVFYLIVLWIAFFGMMAFGSSDIVTRRAKQAGLVTFVVLVVDTMRMTGAS